MISSKTGSCANRPACVRYHLRLKRGLGRLSPRTVSSSAFTRFSIWISVIFLTLLRFLPSTRTSNQDRLRFNPLIGKNYNSFNLGHLDQQIPLDKRSESRGAIWRALVEKLPAFRT